MNYGRFFQSSASVLPKLERSTTKGVLLHSLRHLFSQVSDVPMLLLLERGIVEASHPELCRVDDGQPATIVFDGITQPALKSIDSEQSDRAGILTGMARCIIVAHGIA